MLDWADRKIRARSRQYLRLDCLFENLDLRNYYESLGFEFCGENFNQRDRVALYERIAISE